MNITTKTRVKMKHKLFIITLLATLTLCSCERCKNENGKASRTTPDSTVTTVSQDSLNNNSVQQDSLNLTTNLPSIKNSIEYVNNLKSNVDNLQQQFNAFKEKKESTSQLLEYLILFITVLLSLYLLFKLFKTQKKLDKLNGTLRALKERVNKFEKNNKSTEYLKSVKTSKSFDQRISDFEAKIKELDNRINNIYQALQSSANQKKQEQKIPKPAPVTTKKYADLHSGKYFFKILDSKQETCVYEVILHNEKEAEFHLISIDKIKSRNELETAIEISGKCQLADASSFRELNGGGIIEKIDENTWKVTKKLAIEIS